MQVGAGATLGTGAGAGDPLLGEIFSGFLPFLMRGSLVDRNVGLTGPACCLMLGGGIEGWKSGGSGILVLSVFFLNSLGVECLGPETDLPSLLIIGVLGVKITGVSLLDVDGIGVFAGGAPSRDVLPVDVVVEVSEAVDADAFVFKGSAREV